MPSKQPTQVSPEISKLHNTWYYPQELSHDLDGVDLPQHVKEEALACAWEYSRSVIPVYTNWQRYIAWMRIIVLGVVAEFRGELVNVAASDLALGYSVEGLVNELFAGTPGHAAMLREYRSFLLLTGDKSCPQRRDGKLYTTYAAALVRSPRGWFRLRDCDALARFSIAAALACNDLNDVWFTEDEWEILSEVGDTLYDAVAFFKHRAEAELNSTFAYVPSEIRRLAYHNAREVLLALETAWLGKGKTEYLAVANFIRYFGGPIHMTMRRYRYVEEGMMIGKPETDEVIEKTRQNFKLWNRVDATGETNERGYERFADVLARKDELLFPQLANMLEENNEDRCGKCWYPESYGATTTGRFGGVQLCDGCKEEWRTYVEELPARAARVFSVLQPFASPSDG